METKENFSLFELQVDHESTAYLKETAKWAKFLAILGFIWCGIFFLAGASILATKNSYSPGYTSWVSVLYMALAVLYCLPCLYMLNFARKVKTALQNNDQGYLNTSLRNLRSTFRFLGIAAIVGLVLVAALVFFNLFGRL